MYETLQLDTPDRIIARAWADEEFKRALVADPRKALASQGFEIPEGVTLNVVENSDQVINLVLPKRPDLALTEEALDASVGAAGCGSGGGGGGRCGGGCGGGCGCGGACACHTCLCW